MKAEQIMYLPSWAERMRCVKISFKNSSLVHLEKQWMALFSLPFLSGKDFQVCSFNFYCGFYVQVKQFALGICETKYWQLLTVKGNSQLDDSHPLDSNSNFVEMLNHTWLLAPWFPFFIIYLKFPELNLTSLKKKID